MKTIQLKKDQGALHIELIREDIHNAFDPLMIEELTEAFRGVSSDVRVVVLKGRGKSFCSGADLSWMKGMIRYTQEENFKDSEKLFEMFKVAALCPVPVVGRVHGNVFGGGLGLVAICDVVAALRETKFCFSEVKLGLVPAVISPFVLKKSRSGHIRSYMMSGQIFGEEEARGMGLVQMIGTSEEVDDYVQSQIDFFVSAGPEAVRATKGLLQTIEPWDWDSLKRTTCQVIAARRVSPEGQEGLSAFFEKRKPSWKS